MYCMPYRPPDGPEKYRDKGWLASKYWDERMSQREIAELCDCTKQTIKHWMDRYEISVRDRSKRIEISWEGEEERREKSAKIIKNHRKPWWEMDEETQQQVRERLSEWWSKNNPMEGKTKEENPAWKGGGNRKYYGPNWEEQREKALERDDNSCQKCGCESDLVVHHHVPIRKWRNDDNKQIEKANQLWNLVTLCSECHGSIEGERY